MYFGISGWLNNITFCQTFVISSQNIFSTKAVMNSNKIVIHVSTDINTEKWTLPIVPINVIELGLEFERKALVVF